MANENEGLINYSLKGFVNIDKQTIECFLGDKDDNKSSEEVTKFLKEKELKYSGWDYQIVGKNYRFFFPLIEKSITITTKEGITYYSKIFNIYDIKSIICDHKLFHISILKNIFIMNIISFIVFFIQKKIICIIFN